VEFLGSRIVEGCIERIVELVIACDDEDFWPSLGTPSEKVDIGFLVRITDVSSENESVCSGVRDDPAFRFEVGFGGDTWIVFEVKIRGVLDLYSCSV
jgi:hypothetical protein